MRCSMEWVSLRAPSAVWIIDMPSWLFRTAWSSPRTWARIFSDMASPAASSAAELMRSPVESLLMDFSSCMLVTASELYANSAGML
ncbi:MAG: hypothetical protein BWY99_02859 [Synergistetes bacterium ADurb.BinA166]|nr:MAG: hypothetical protein BWY99_02859 [Synergistetes bacterium ADurb.BinA166]